MNQPYRDPRAPAVTVFGWCLIALLIIIAVSFVVYNLKRAAKSDGASSSNRRSKVATADNLSNPVQVERRGGEYVAVLDLPTSTILSKLSVTCNGILVVSYDTDEGGPWILIYGRGEMPPDPHVQNAQPDPVSLDAITAYRIKWEKPGASIPITCSENPRAATPGKVAARFTFSASRC